MITLISAIHTSRKCNYYKTYKNSYQLQKQQHTGTAVRSGRGTLFDTQHSKVLVCVLRRRLFVTYITTFLQNSQKLPRVSPRVRTNP
jgi:hypothetical protein